MFTLRYIEGGVEKTHSLKEGQTLVGRLPACDLMIAEQTVSRQHAWIRVEGGRCFLKDAGSRFGTFRAGQRVQEEIELAVGDVFNIGQIALSIEQNTSEQEILSEHHQLVEESGTVFRRLVVEDRRTLPDRRKEDSSGRTFSERRSGRERRGGRIIRLLSEIGKTLVTIQPLSDVLNRVVDLVFTVVPSERAFLMLRESADEGLTARVMRHRDGSIPQSATLSRTVVKRVMREKVAVQAFDATADARLGVADSILALNIRSFMCAPLWNHHDVIGVLYVDNPRTRRFTPDDLDVFTALANYAAVAIEQARLSEQLLEETRRRERLQRYHSPSVVNRIMRSTPGDETLDAQERDVTVMICDLVGFTTFCERRTPAEVAGVLNTWLTRMTDVVFANEGTLDKYLGDALLAVFGAPFEHAQHALCAATAALEMRRAMAALNDELPDLRLEMRIAINSGRALTGDIGSPRRREFTVLGDVVNTASRIEGEVAKPGQIVLSQMTWERIRDKVKARSLGTVTLRGRATPLECFELEH
jgi:adenylate cyclase